MALYGTVLRPKQKMQQDQSAIAQMGAPQKQPMTGAAPPALGNARPRVAGNVAPAALGGASKAPTAQGAFARELTPTPAPKGQPGQSMGNIPVTGPGQRGAAPPTAGVQVPINTSPTPTPEPAAPPATQDDVDQMIRDLIVSRLSGAGQADTSAEEALIQQRMQGDLGQSLVNQRARMGRAGFGASGATAAIEGDIRRAAAQDALEQTLGLRRTEDQRSIDNALRAVGAEQGMRSAAANDDLRRMALEALQAEMGLDAGPQTLEQQQAQWRQDAIAAGADTNGDGQLSQQERDAYIAQEQAGHQAWSDFYNQGGDVGSLPVLPGPGEGWEMVFPPGTDRDGNPKPGQLYNASTGELAVYY